MGETSNQADCRAVEDRLVDYADKTLSAAEAAEVRRHLDGCTACRGEVAALRRSLTLAESVWLDSRVELASQGVNRQTTSERRAWQGPGRRFAWLVGSGAAAMAVLILCWNSFSIRRSPSVVQHVPRTEQTPANDGANVVEPDSRNVMDEVEAMEIADIEAFLRREEQAARLAMSIQILAEVPSAHEELARAKSYLEAAYGVSTPDTPLNDDPL